VLWDIISGHHPKKLQTQFQSGRRGTVTQVRHPVVNERVRKPNFLSATGVAKEGNEKIEKNYTAAHVEVGTA